MAVTLTSIQEARARIAGHVLHTPCPYSYWLSRSSGCEVYCKLDNTQQTGSFKERGARNRLMLLDEATRRRGVIAASAGNHALALAYHGQAMGVPVTVVMPKWAPIVKAANCRALGARVILHGDTFDEARQHANLICQQDQLTYVHGFNDEPIIDGAGTMGLEILEDVPDVDAIIVPVGGGGLVAGLGTAVKALKPGVRIVAAESQNAPTLDAAMKAGRPVKIETRPSLADGLAIQELGANCFELCARVVDELILVDEGEIANAVLKLLELEKTLAEGAGASSLAALWHRREDFRGKKVVLCVCGGNIDVNVLGHIIERGLASEGRLCRIVAGISDRPGGLAHFTAVLAATGASVKDISHDRHFGPADVARVRVSCVLETRDLEHIREIHAALVRAGIEVIA
jgi:threonine dehydratase